MATLKTYHLLRKDLVRLLIDLFAGTALFSFPHHLKKYSPLNSPSKMGLDLQNMC